MSERFLIKVFFDADALIAGSASQSGASHILLQLAELGLIRGYTSDQVLDECRRNLKQKLPDALPHFEKIVSLTLTVLKNPQQKQLNKYSGMAHKKDLPVLVSALNENTHYLATFNTKDFSPDPGKKKLKIVEPGKLLKNIRKVLLQLGE